VFTLGFGLIWVVPKVVAKVAQVAAQIADLVKKTVQALKNLVPLLKKAGDLFDDAAKALKNIKTTKADTPSKPGGEGTPKSIDGPPNPRGGDSTTPSGAPKSDTSSPPPPRTEPKPEPKPGDSTSPSGAPTPQPKPQPRSGDTPPPRSRGGDSLRDQGSNPRSMDNIRCVGDPIDVSTGQMVMHEVDAEFLGTLPLVLERAHFSSYRAGRWFGASWMSTLDVRLEVHDDQVSFAAADGTIQVFPRPRGEEWVAAERGPARLLSEAPGGGFVIEDRERARLLFFGPGAGVLPIESISDRNGDHIVFERDEQGVPTEVWHSGGYRVRVTTADGLVTALSSVAGDSVVELVRYGYDQQRRLTEVTNASGLPFRYSYDESGRIVAWADRNEEWYRYVYDGAGRVVRTEGSGGALTGTMEYDDRVTHSTDSLGHRTTFHMNEFGQVVREIDPLGGVTAYEWDARDRLVSETDPLGRRTSYRHDPAGNVVAVVRPDGTEMTVERNEFGLPVHLVEAPGVETRWEFDERGNLTKVVEPDGATTLYTHDEWGHLASVTDPAGMTLSVVSDGSGLPVTVTDPRGAVTTYEHDRFGRLVAVTDPMGAVERFGYTVEGALAWHRRADGTTEKWLFDGEGNDRVHTDAAAAVIRAEVTHFDLPSAQIHADGSRVDFAYDTELRLVAVTNEQRQVWRYEYDAAGNLVRETDFGGATMDYRYDSAGQLTEVRNAAGETVSLSRDVLGNVVEEVTAAGRTRYTYSDVGHLLVMDDGTTRVEYARDPVGRVLAETVNGRTVHSEYDRAGRRTRRRTPSGAESVWEYDEAGNPAAVHTAGRSMRFEYDLAGREVRRTFGSGTAILHSWTPTGLVAGQVVVSAAGLLGQERSYRYRPDGLPVQADDRLSGPRSFSLDERGRVTAVAAQRWTERYAYDVAGRLAEATWPAPSGEELLGTRSVSGSVVTGAGRVRYTYDECGRMVSRDHGDSRVWHYTWGPRNRLVAVRTPDGSLWHYTYDPLGRRVRKEHVAADGVAVLERVEFTWDDEVLVEQARSVAGGTEITVWDYEPDSFRPLLQRHGAGRAPQDWVDEQFYAIVADPAGAPAELVNEQGGIEWFARTSLFGVMIDESGGASTPLRFQGQYFDAETGLHYNFHRYYDPAIARYLSPDPIGLVGGPDPHAYVHNPHAFADPLGLTSQSCRGRSGGGNRSPRREQSPGGTTYQAGAPSGRYSSASRRHAAGYDNPSHSHANMLPHWRRAAASPPPRFRNRAEERRWLMDQRRRYRATSPSGRQTGIIQGHSNGVLGHNPSASAHWNNNGMQNTRQSNIQHNRDTNTYHGIEDRGRSNASGASEPRFQDPTPSNGANRIYWDPRTPGYQGGPWPSWSPYNPPTGGSGGGGASSGGSGGSSSGGGGRR
jgi:RHS repeat-associated protein